MFTPSGSTLLHVAWISHPRDRMKGFMWRSKSSIAFTSCEKTEAGVTMNWRAGYFNWWFFGGKRTGYLYSKSGLKSFQIKESESFFKRAPHLHLWKWSPNMENHFQPPPSHSQCLQEICNEKQVRRCCFPASFLKPHLTHFFRVPPSCKVQVHHLQAPGRFQ